ncbi:hypothetical protein D3C84_1152780 [compost metagenome]
MRLGKATDPEFDSVNPLYDASAVGLEGYADIRIDRLESRYLIRIEDKVWIGLLELGNHCIAQIVALLEVLPRCIG